MKAFTEDESFNSFIELEEWKNYFKNDLNTLHFRLGGEMTVEEMSKNYEKGLNYLKDQQKLILTVILSELIKRYPKWQEQYGYNDDEKIEIMPDIIDLNDFSNLILPVKIQILPVFKDGFPYMGYEFKCSWDEEHGLGIMMFKDRIVKIGGVDTSFLIWIAEDDMELE